MNNSSKQSKSAQRQIIRTQLKTLDSAYQKDSDQAICKKVLSLPDYQNSHFLFCYISVDKEINTAPIIEDAWASGKRVAVPRCISKGIMELYEIISFDDLEPGNYNIPEPGTHCQKVDSSEIDFAIIPNISCDRNCNRLGHGGGYYDRYLAGATFTTAAICREQLLLDDICMEKYDLPVDYVVTETTIYHR